MIGENLSLRRVAAIEVGEGVVGSYVHSALAPGLGKIGVLVGLQSAGDPEQLGALGKQLAMHIAAAKPLAVSVDRLDAARSSSASAPSTPSRRALRASPTASSTRSSTAACASSTRRSCCWSRRYVIDPDLKVKAAIERVAESIGSTITVTGFERFALGEGLAPKTSNLAEEVAQLADT